MHHHSCRFRLYYVSTQSAYQDICHCNIHCFVCPKPCSDEPCNIEVPGLHLIKHNVWGHSLTIAKLNIPFSCDSVEYLEIILEAVFGTTEMLALGNKVCNKNKEMFTAVDIIFSIPFRINAYPVDCVWALSYTCIYSVCCGLSVSILRVIMGGVPLKKEVKTFSMLQDSVCGLGKQAVLFTLILGIYHMCPKIWKSPLQYLLMCPKSAGYVANRVDPDQMPHSIASDLSLHCLLVCPSNQE